MKAGASKRGYAVRRIPSERIPQIELMPVLALRNAMHGFVEVDVTAARQRLRELRQRDGSRLSFAAFVITCLARAVDTDRQVQAFPRGRRLVEFDTVDVSTLVEVDADGHLVPLPYVVRDAVSKSVFDVHREIRAVQTDPGPLLTEVRRKIGLLGRVPRPLRWLVWRAMRRSPRLFKRFGGTVVVTSVGMFGSGRAWGAGLVSYPVTVTIGGISSRPALRDRALEEREYLCLTVSLDHEVIDGAPAARFMATFRDLLERGHGLQAVAPVRSDVPAAARPATSTLGE